jgi:hypothetical protein
MGPTLAAQCARRQQVNKTVEISSGGVNANLGGWNKLRFESSLHSLRSAIEFAIKLLHVDSSPGVHLAARSLASDRWASEMHLALATRTRTTVVPVV